MDTRLVYYILHLDYNHTTPNCTFCLLFSSSSRCLLSSFVEKVPDYELKQGRPSGQLPSKFVGGPQNVKTKSPNGPWKCWLSSILICKRYQIKANKYGPENKEEAIIFLIPGDKMALKIFDVFRPMWIISLEQINICNS